MLGIYCDAVAKYRQVSKRIDGVDGEDGKPTDETIKEAQAWARLVATYADKLGLSPSARARLAKKRAERAPVDPMEALLNDVRDFVNNDQDNR
jgi:phage terminase small subunit